MRISDWSSDVCSSDLALNGEIAARKIDTAEAVFADQCDIGSQFEGAFTIGIADLVGIDVGSGAIKRECDVIVCRVFDDYGFGNRGFICLGEGRIGGKGQTGKETSSCKIGRANV